MPARRSWVAAAASVLALLIAPAAGGAAPREFFGVTPQTLLQPDDFERMSQAGVGTLRFELSWSSTDPTSAPGDLDWSRADAVVGAAAARGIQPLPFVFGTPTWVAEADGFACGTDCSGFIPRGPAALAAWREFLAAAARRYGPGGAFWTEHPQLPETPVRAWQLWNEQNSPSFFRPRPNIDTYAALVHAADEAMAGVDPEAEIVLGGMFATPLGGRKPGIAAPRFLARLYRRPRMEASFDGVAAHPYGASFGKVLGQIKELRKRMINAGDAAGGLWITELGWASAGVPDPLNRGPAGQAQRLTEAFKYFLKKRGRLNIRTVNWYSWRDNPEPGAGLCTWCPYSGLVTADLSEKPSLKAYTRFTSGS